MLKSIRYVECYGGNCHLTTDTPREIRQRIGTENVERIRFATRQDKEWVESAGGRVPRGRIRSTRRAASR